MNVKSLCPAGEILWTTYYKNNEPKYIITSKIGSREYYFLYPIENGNRGKRIGKCAHPSSLK